MRIFLLIWEKPNFSVVYNEVYKDWMNDQESKFLVATVAYIIIHG